MTLEVEIEGERSKYWDGYYAGVNLPSVPSQFSVFVLNENPDAKVIVDIGCGTGRDSLFFSKHGVFCVGVDGSESAIEYCNKVARRNSVSNIRFMKRNLSDTQLSGDVSKILSEHDYNGDIIVYVRFVVHAITEEEEKQLIDHASEMLGDRDGCVALEFRTERDKQQPKSTEAHFRRYVDPVHFFNRVQKYGFDVEYFVEGFGLAKYKQDDAHVARFILRKTK